MTDDRIPKTEEEWKDKLTEEQYKILRKKGTEPPFSGKYVNKVEKGIYACAACGNQLFSSDTQYESTTPGLQGWPAFEDAIPGAVEFRPDDSHGMRRTEVVCARCKSHLGHIFDEETETRERKHYCINSACLILKKDE